MKIKNIVKIVVSICLVFAFYGFSNNDVAKIITRKWQITSMRNDTIDNRLARAKVQFDTAKYENSKGAVAMPAALLQMVKDAVESMKGANVEYKADGTYNMNATINGQNTTGGGKWIIINDGKRLILTHDNNAPNDTADIISASEDSLVLSSGMNSPGALQLNNLGVIVMTLKAVK